MKLREKSNGFTLIELLVVIAIIGLLSTLAVVSFGNARQRSRDSKRVADVKSIQTALELYYSENDNYPVESTAVTPGGGGLNDVICNGPAGLADAPSNPPCTTIYMSPIPTAPSTAGINGYSYSTDASGSTYTLTFGTEQSNLSGLAQTTTHSATPGGMQ